MADGRYAQHPGKPSRRAEDRLPDEDRPRYSVTDLVEALREVRDAEPTGVKPLPKPDVELADSFKPRLHFTARVVGVLIALAVAVGSIAAALAWTGSVVDDRAKGVLVRGGLMCPERDPSIAVDPRYACKSLPQQIGEVRDAQAETNRLLDALLKRLPQEPAP